MEAFSPARECRVVHQVDVPMRDGVALATTVYLPLEEGPFPTVLVRTAYNRQGVRDLWYPQHGFAYVTQDCRGRYGSLGQHWPFVSEMADGEDTLRWLHAQPWCNGKIGMYGDSYLAATQFYATYHAAGLLTALNPRFMCGDGWKHAYYVDGALSLGLTWSWLCLECAGRTSSAGMMPLYDVAAALRHLPLVELDVHTTGSVVPAYRDYVSRHQYDSGWQHLSLRDKHDRFTMPVLLTGGWYDYYAGEAATTFLGLLQASPPELARQHRLLIGPWTHGIGSNRLGQLDFGPDATAENDHTHRWLEAMLTHGDAARFQAAPVRYFCMGVNQWRDAATWPPPGTHLVPWYLHSGGAANSSLGDGALSPTAPTAPEPPDRFTYNPDDPVPTLGGSHSIGPYNPGLYELAPPGPYDQRPLERRDDVLVYTSAPFDRPVEVTGPVIVKLWAASSARDTDFTAKLIDVYPDGRAMNVADGVLRARFRRSVYAPPELLEPGRVYEFTLDLQVTSNVFLPGHRLRLDLSSSCWPLWDRNLNTGEDPATGTRWELAHQTIRHDPEHPSHVLLPIVG